jgi:hypothetical protein
MKSRRGTLTAIIFLLSSGVGVLTNLATDHWQPAVTVGLVVLAVAVAGLVWYEYGRGDGVSANAAATPAAARSRVRQIADSGSIEGSNITTRGAAEVEEMAETDGKITDSSISADGADVERRAQDGGRIDNSHIRAE